MVINHIHFEVPPCCQGSLTAALCEGEQSRKGRTKSMGAGPSCHGAGACREPPLAAAWQGGVNAGAGPGSQRKDESKGGWGMSPGSSRRTRRALTRKGGLGDRVRHCDPGQVI